MAFTSGITYYTSMWIGVHKRAITQSNYWSYSSELDIPGSVISGDSISNTAEKSI